MDDDVNALLSEKISMAPDYGKQILEDFVVWGVQEHKALDERSKEEGFQQLHRDAEKGDSHAMYSLGMRYASGWTIEMASNACVWFRKSAEMGHAHAQFALGLRYLYDGHGVDEDMEEAFRWLFKAADSGCPVMEYALAFCYANGVGVQKDETKAFELYRRSAEQGYAYAQFSLGLFCHQGTGTGRDDAEALVWYQRCAEQEHAAGQHNLGVCYGKGYGVQRDWKEAFGWFCRSMEQWHKHWNAKWVCSAQRDSVGLCISHGVGLVEWGSDPVAQFAIGYCLANGVGVKKNLEKGFEWYQKSAQQGNAAGQLELGRCYEYGHGVVWNDAKMLHWYLRSAEQGNAGACEEVGRCYSLGCAVNSDEGAAFAWFRRHLELGYRGQHANAYFSEFFLLTRNKGRAYAWYARWARRGGSSERDVQQMDPSYKKAWLEMSGGDDIAALTDAWPPKAPCTVPVQVMHKGSSTGDEKEERTLQTIVEEPRELHAENWEHVSAVDKQDKKESGNGEEKEKRTVGRIVEEALQPQVENRQHIGAPGKEDKELGVAQGEKEQAYKAFAESVKAQLDVATNLWRSSLERVAELEQQLKSKDDKVEEAFQLQEMNRGLITRLERQVKALREKEQTGIQNHECRMKNLQAERDKALKLQQASERRATELEQQMKEMGKKEEVYQASMEILEAKLEVATQLWKSSLAYMPELEKHLKTMEKEEEGNGGEKEERIRDLEKKVEEAYKVQAGCRTRITGLEQQVKELGEKEQARIATAEILQAHLETSARFLKSSLERVAELV